MIVTTSQKANEQVLEKARAIAAQWGADFVERNGKSLQALFSESGEKEILVISQGRIQWHVQGVARPFFFHPGLSAVRIKRLLRGDNDIMIETCQLQPGDYFLDCTLGLAADSIVASHAVGPKGRVVGIESEPLVAFLVSEGLKKVRLYPEINRAAERVEVIQGNHLDILKGLPDRSFDVVYFDPMFRQGLNESASLKVLRNYANPEPVTEEAIEHAMRVTRRLVVMKELKHSGEFERLGFASGRRESMDVAYGVIDVRGDCP